MDRKSFPKDGFVKNYRKGMNKGGYVYEGEKTADVLEKHLAGQTVSDLVIELAIEEAFNYHYNRLAGDPTWASSPFGLMMIQMSMPQVKSSMKEALLAMCA